MAQIIYLAEFRQQSVERDQTVFGRFSRRLTAFGGSFATGMRALARMQDVGHLLRLSDSELAQRGLSRRRIEAYVFGQ